MVQLMNYHELTMHEDRNSPARRKQFLVICSVMAATFAYSTLTAGILSPVNIMEGTFPGGTFVYKSTKRDYSAAPSLGNQVGQDLGIKERQQEYKIYTIFLDHPNTITDGRKQRFASGFLAKADDESDQTMADTLLDMNDEIKPVTKGEVLDLAATDLWPRLRYKQQSLPAVKAAVLYFPFSNGFVSSLMFTIRILPVLRKFAMERLLEAGVTAPSVTIVTTCNVEESLCTHYAPLVVDDAENPFLLGQLRMEEYAKTLPKDEWIDFERIGRMIKRSGVAQKLGFGSVLSSSPSSDAKEEL